MKNRYMLFVLSVLLAGAIMLQSTPALGDEPCPLPDVVPALAEIVVLLLDTNHDGQLFLSEVRVVYPDMDSMMFMLLDSNFNGRLSPAEVAGAVNLLGVDVMGYMDTNGDGLIQYEETSGYLTPEMFIHFDINRNNVIDCEDYAYFMVPPAHGEGEDACGSADMMYFVAYAAMLFLDVDGDDVVTFDELETLAGPEYAAMLLAVLDRDDSESADQDEVLALLLDLPFDIIRIIDLDQDGAISPEDLNGMLPPEALAMVDYNGDGVLYCDDLEVLPIDEDWGVLPYPTDDMLSEHLLALLRRLFSILDVNGDNALSYEEIRSRIALPQRLFMALDINGDGLITWDELEHWLAYLAAVPSDVVIEFSREIVGTVAGNFFVPGEPLLVRITSNKFGLEPITRFSITEMLPEGWAVGAVHNKGTAQVAVESVPGGNKMTIVWEDEAPLFPAALSYELVPPADASGMVSIMGHVGFTTDEGVRHSGGMVPTMLVEMLTPEFTHTADTNGDWRISLSELLRIIQLYNSGAYHVNAITVDGYDVGEGPTDGPPHNADYLGDWRITLPELLRIIQLYNAPSRCYYVAGDTEDGYMPAPF